MSQFWGMKMGLGKCCSTIFGAIPRLVIYFTNIHVPTISLREFSIDMLQSRPTFFRRNKIYRTLRDCGAKRLSLRTNQPTQNGPPFSTSTNSQKRKKFLGYGRDTSLSLAPWILTRGTNPTLPPPKVASPEYS